MHEDQSAEIDSEAEIDSKVGVDIASSLGSFQWKEDAPQNGSSPSGRSSDKLQPARGTRDGRPAPFGTIRILFIRNDPGEQQRLIDEVRQEFPDMEALTAADWTDLDSALDEEDALLVITDYALGWTDGLAILRAVKARRAHCPVVMVTKDGNERIAVEAMKAGLDEYVGKTDDGFAAVRVAVREAQEHALRRRRLWEAQARYRSIVENAQEGLFDASPSGAIVWANPATARLLGYASPVELVRAGRTIFEGFVGRDARTKLLRSLDERDGVSGFETQMLRRDGQVVWLSISARMLRAVRGERAAIQGSMQDITDRKSAQEGLSKSEERFRSCIETMPDPLCICSAMRDPEGQIIDFGIEYLNAAASEYFGTANGESKGKSVFALFQDPGARELFADYRSVIETGRPLALDSLPFESLRDGTREVRKFDIRAVKLQDGFALVWRDVTDRDRTIQALEEVRAELERRAAKLELSNGELEQFAYVASHDLQEPLRTVASYVELLSRRYAGQLDADADDFIGFAVDGVTRMQALINDLLTFSRVSRQGQAFGPTDCQVALLQALSDLNASIKESGARVTHDSLPVILADGYQLVQLFDNLIGNAIKFRGEAPPRIHVRAEREGDGWQFSVSDNGIGIDARYAERIFVIFQRLHTREEYSGTGIGLAICKKIVERHGGRIWVKSDPGAGSTFNFTVAPFGGNSDSESHE